MLDYLFERSDGKKVTIENMSTEDINDCLNDGISIYSNVNHSSIIERLKLELDIRRMINEY